MGLRILVVDDDVADRKLIRRALRRAEPPFDFDESDTLDAADARLADDAYDCVLLDLNLGGGASGMALLERYASAAARAAFIVVTGQMDDASGLEAMRRGAEDFVTKDEVPRRLLRVVSFAIERKQMERRLEDARRQLAEANVSDPLTGLRNRRGLEELLQIEVRSAHRTSGVLCAAMIDCDRFKEVNDRLGHAVGDAVLAGVAGRLRTALRPSDHVGRVGGDEFLVLLPDTRLPEAVHALDRVRIAIREQPLAVSDTGMKMTVSAGVTRVPSGVASLQEILQLTRVALRASKSQGGNRVSVAGAARDWGPDSTGAERLLRPESFYGVAQSIRDVATEAVAGHECLARSRIEGLSSPADFFGVARDLNILDIVDLNCLRACAARAASAADPVHLNLLPSTLLATPAGRLLDLLGDLPTGRTCVLEISEQQFIGNPAVMLDAVADLRAHGLRIGLDDVGFGRSSLETLILVEPDTVKIDQRFIQGCASDSGLRRWLERLVRVLDALGASIVAEGVETEADLDIVRELGVRSAQGFYWDRPA